MTDKLDKTFNITPEVVKEETKVVKKEKPEAKIPTKASQTTINQEMQYQKQTLINKTNSRRNLT